KGDVRLVEHHDILNADRFDCSPALNQAWLDVQAGIEATDWPWGSGRFSLHPGKCLNGVKPIKEPCVDVLRARGWLTERIPVLSSDSVLTPGDLDALKETTEGPIGFEWETGNISSSHRAINKLLLTLQVGNLLGGFLVVPSR